MTTPPRAPRTPRTPRSPGSGRRTAVALAAVALLALTACAPGDTSASSEPRAAREQLPEVDPATAALPRPLSDRRLVDPGWATVAKELDGVFLAPRETGAGTLEYLAVDASGEVLWAATRPPSCTGFVLTTTEAGQPVAILTDQAPSRTRIADPVASAYDLRTGEQLWGPTRVTGPYKGPGLVFAAPPAGFMGEVGEKVALDPQSGAPIARESTLDGARIIGEYHGDVLTITEERITSLSRAHGTLVPSWEIPLAGTGWDPTLIGNATRHHELGAAFLSIPTTAATDTIVASQTGRVIVDEVLDAARDPLTGVLIASTEAAIRGFTAAGELIWEIPRDPAVQLVGAGSGIAFLRDGERNTALAASDGSRATDIFPGAAAAAEVYLPTLSTPGGAAVVERGAQRMLVTTEPAPPSSH